MAVTSNRHMIDSADPSTLMLGADDSPGGEAVMAPVLDQSVDEAAALLRAPKGLPRKQRFREGVLRASAAGRRALVALGWPAIRDSDWQGADGQVAFDGDLEPRRFPVGSKPAVQLTLTLRAATIRRVGPCSSSRDREEPSGGSAVTYWWKR